MVQKNRVKKHAKYDIPRDDSKLRFIAIGGPTCIGKSAYAIKLAKKYNGEIISADSVQIYKKLNIGSGKVTEEEMQGIPHHLLDIIMPNQTITIADFADMARKCIKEIISRGKLPIVVGGTGLYIDALLNDYSCGDSAPNYDIRERMTSVQEVFLEDYMKSSLDSLDDESILNKKDAPRLEREIEQWLDGSAFDLSDESDCYEEPYDALLLFLDNDRNLIDELAEKRIYYMLDHGLIEEVRKLRAYWNYKSMNSSVGYRDVITGLKHRADKQTIADMMMDSYHALIKKQQMFFNSIRWGNKAHIVDGDFKKADVAVREFMGR